jgi:hypothetical protein
VSVEVWGVSETILGGVAVSVQDGSFPVVAEHVFVTPLPDCNVIVYVMGGFTKVSIAIDEVAGVSNGVGAGVIPATFHESGTGVVIISGVGDSQSLVVHSRSTSCPIAITQGVTNTPVFFSLHFKVHCGLSFTVTEQAFGTVPEGFVRSIQYVF